MEGESAKNDADWAEEQKLFHIITQIWCFETHVGPILAKFNNMKSPPIKESADDISSKCVNLSHHLDLNGWGFGYCQGMACWGSERVMNTSISDQIWDASSEIYIFSEKVVIYLSILVIVEL